MLYLLNSVHQGEQAWQQVENMLHVGDSVLLYEHALELLVNADHIALLLAWLDRGIKIFVLAGQENEELTLPKVLHDDVTVVDWEGFVDLTVNEQQVCAL